MNTVPPTMSGNSAPEKIVMVGAAVPQDVMDALMNADLFPQVQTHKLSWAVILGIEATGKVVDLISTVAISDYPRSKWLWSGYRRWDRGNGSDNRLGPFINVLGFKHVTRFLSCLVLLVRWAIANRGRRRRVLLYSLLTAHLYAVRCVRLFFPMKTAVLITDLPGLTTLPEPWWRRMVRPIDRGLIYRAIRAMDGLIVLTRQIAEDHAPRVPAIVVEGIVSVESEKLAYAAPERTPRSGQFVILYAGCLSRYYGIPLLLDAFAELPGEEFRLWILGGGGMESEIRRRAQEDPRIFFPGMVTPKEAFQRSLEATVLIEPRPSKQCFTPYSFPSKLLEYMATGRPVVSTRLPGIPAEYEPYMVWVDEETPEGLAAVLRRLQEQPREQLTELGRRAQDFVLREKNYRQQGRRIVEFMQHIDSPADKRC